MKIKVYGQTFLNCYEIVQAYLAMALTGIPPQRKAALSKLTDKELVIARLVRDGYMSKEIAEKLCLSKNL